VQEAPVLDPCYRNAMLNVDLTHNTSIIIPILNDKINALSLINELNNLSKNLEIIVVGTEDDITFPKNVIYITAPVGRSYQLNAGAKASNRDYLWFMHADSKFTQKTTDLLRRPVKLHKNSVHYFDLKFYDYSWPIKINEFGVYLRSHLFGMPFGDQALLLEKTIFEKLKGFPEEKKVAEDHYFIWKARQNGYKIKPINLSIKTSARKYTDNGWLKTTGQHLFLTYKQAVPEFLKLLRKSK
jgi:glycosyltransferase involved in cell wall biosynthesis